MSFEYELFIIGEKHTGNVCERLPIQVSLSVYKNQRGNKRVNE